MPYADRTTVPIERTKAEVEQTLTRYGADRFASYAESAVEGPTRWSSYSRLTRGACVSTFRLRVARTRAVNGCVAATGGRFCSSADQVRSRADRRRYRQ